MTDPKLEACPFCKSGAQIYNQSGMFWVHCTNDLGCAAHVGTMFTTEERAIAAWNRRIPPAREPSQLEQAAKQVVFAWDTICEIPVHDEDWMAFAELKMHNLIDGGLRAALDHPSPEPPMTEGE